MIVSTHVSNIFDFADEIILWYLKLTQQLEPNASVDKFACLNLFLKKKRKDVYILQIVSQLLMRYNAKENLS